MTREATIAALDHILPEYTRISSAPDGGAMMLMTHEEVLEETARRYKAVNENGDVLVMQNPAAWRAKTHSNGIKSYYPAQPELKMTRSDVAKSQGGTRMSNRRGTDFNFEPKSPWDAEDSEKVRVIKSGRKGDNW